MSTETPTDRFRAVGATLKGELRVDALIAEGGFGVVYRATHLGLDRPVALKVLKTPPEYNDEAREAFIERFKQEARTVLRVNHPAVVQVLDFGASAFPSGEEAAWTAMEWVEGATLEDELRARRKQGGRHPKDVLALLRPVIEAVAVAHDEGIAHRDLKPANIMVVRGKRAVTARLLDFGIAKTMEPGEEAGSGRTRTSSTMIACSPRYAAPEQLSSARTGPWSDVHALAMILSEMLTDRLGYAGKDTTALFVEALSAVRPSPAKRSIDVGAWEPVLQKALAIRPDDRYANAGELLAALDEALPGATHPKTPEGIGARISEVPSAPSQHVTSPTTLGQTAAAGPSVPLPDDDDDAPGPLASGPRSTPAAPPTVAAITGTQILPPESLPSTGSTTLRGVSASNAPPAPSPPGAVKRGPLPLLAAGLAVALAAAAGLALTRSPSPPSAPATAPRVAPTVVAAAPTVLAVAAPAADAGAGAAQGVADAAVVAATVAAEDASVPREGRRSSRRRRRPAAGESYNVD